MIKNYNGQKAEKATSNTPLPAGGYVAQIVSARIEDYSWGSVVIIAFDITEGEYTNFFKKQFEANQSEDKKWKGTYRLTIPDENSKYFETNKRIFNNFIFAIEDSNNGYHYDCDEKKFKGKKIGVIYRDKQWEMNGNTGWTTECGAVTDITAIKENTFKQLKPKSLNNSTSKPTNAITEQTDVIEEDDLPF